MRKILLIDDDEVLVDLYKTKFEQEGFEMFTALKGEEGLQIAKEKTPDLIVLDILLPDGNGISFLKRIREDSETASILVVAFSNLNDPETKKSALELGAKDYLLKANITPTELVKKIREYLK